MILKYITSAKVDKAALGLREANAVSTLSANSEALPGFPKIFLAIFFKALGPFFPRDLRKSHVPIAAIVSPLTVMNVCLIHIDQ